MPEGSSPSLYAARRKLYSNELHKLESIPSGLPRIGGQVNACVLLSDPNPAGVRSFRCAGAQGSRSKPGSAKVDLAEAV